MTKNKRKSPRRQMSYAAWLAYEGDAHHVCALHDISQTGARLNVKNSESVPDRFILMLSANGAARRYCQVVWRQPHQVGVRFEAPPADTETTGLAPALDPDLPNQAVTEDSTEPA